MAFAYAEDIAYSDDLPYIGGGGSCPAGLVCRPATGSATRPSAGVIDRPGPLD